MNNPKVSIIIPVYNAEKYLKKCISSLLEQTLSEIEILAVDDGSADGSYVLLQTLAEKDHRIHPFHIENSGPGVARQYALDHASGQYILFCDADDYYMPTMCERMVSEIERTNSDWGICDFILEGNDHPSSMATFSARYTEHNIPSSGKVLWCHIFKKDILDNYNIRFPASFYGEDIAFISKYVYVSRSYFSLAEKLYVHTDNDSSLMGTVASGGNVKKLINSMAAHFDVANFLQQHNLWALHSPHLYTNMERALIFIVPRLAPADFNELFAMMAVFLKDKAVTPNFELLSAIKNNQPQKLQKYARTTSLERTRRVKLFGLTLVKIKNLEHAQKVYFLGLTIRKRSF